MNQLKPMIIVLIMLSSVLAGCISSGMDGQDGTIGLDGADGADGNDGMQGGIGPQGEVGEQGPPGIQGESGLPGSDGIDVNETRIAELEAVLANLNETIIQLQNNISILEDDLTNATTCQLVPWGNCPRVDLNGMDLSGLDLTGINLRGASLIGTNFSGAILHKSILSDVDAWNSSFAFASIDNADLSDSRFWKYEWNNNCQFCHNAANFSGSSVIDSDMTNIYLRNADLTTIFFRGSNLDGSDLSNSDLSNQYLLDTEMTNVILNYANLTNTQFFDMNLEGSSFIYAELNQTFFSNVKCT